MNKWADVAIIGGGAIGCSVAYHAAVRGAQVALFEADQLGSGASGALAGMLSGQGEAEKPGPLRDLLIRGREYHRTFAQELYETTDFDPGYVWDGALRTAVDESSEQKLREEHSWHEQADLPSELLSGEEARELEPAISPEVTTAIYLPDDGQVNPPQLLEAFVRGAKMHGTEIFESTRVTGFMVEGHRVTGVRTTQGEFSAGAVVLAGGAFSGLLSEQLGIRLQLYPIKGQMIELQAWSLPIKANVWNVGNFYVVPKKDGRVIVGATEETGIHDPRPTLGGIQELADEALRLVPALSEARFSRPWGGLRPATQSGDPIMGPAEGWDGLILATGHFRNGVLLSAITGEIVGALALEEKPSMDISPFMPGTTKTAW